MRRILVALAPTIFSLFFITLLISTFVAGTATAIAVETPNLDRSDIRTSGIIPAVSLPETEWVEAAALASLSLHVNYANAGWIQGETDIGATVTITLTDNSGAHKDGAVVSEDGSGHFELFDCGLWVSGDCPDIVPGDRVFASSDSGATAEISPIGEINGTMDEDTNVVSGFLDATWLSNPVDINCDVWGFPISATVSTTADPAVGTFSCDFDDDGHDLQKGEQVALTYFEGDGDAVTNHPEWPRMIVNYGHDWVGATYNPGHTFWITVTDNPGGVKATAIITSELSGGDGNGGFNTQHWHWSPQQPDIIPYDWVYFKADDGYTNTIAVGEITGNVDASADSITGNVLAAGFGVSLTVECHPWGAWDAGIHDAPTKDSWAEPDGSVPYACDWDPATEWDVQPGQQIGVIYHEPDFDRVMGSFSEPAPYLRIDMQGDGDAAEGGNFLFHIDYWNDGDAPAENVVITSTLHGLTYLVDTSPFSVMTGTIPGGEYASLDVGTVDPGEGGSLDLYATVMAAASEPISNVTEIATSTAGDQGDPGEKSILWEGTVQSNDTHLNVGKWAWTGDPAAGYDTVFSVNVCNNGSTGSSEVWLNDNLHHPATSLQSWWPQHPGWYELWSNDGEIMLANPSIPSHSCSEVYIRVTLTSTLQPGDDLTNLAIISSTSDLETDDNEAWWYGNVGQPRNNLSIGKWFNGGVLAPDGLLNYGIGYNNEGNVPSGPFWITDTFPISTTFVGAWHNDPTGGCDFPPDVVTDDYAAWEIPNLDNGYGGDFWIELAVDPAANPGLILNEVEITPLPDEDRYDDNYASAAEELNESGPNLRVQKWHWWGGESGDSRLDYQIGFQNIGDEMISSVWISDDLPLGVTWDGGWHMEFDWSRLDNFTETNGTLGWHFTELYPGDSGWLYFSVDLDEPGEPLRWYTNTVEITTPPGDTNPGDNAWEDHAFSGPEVRRVEFWLNRDDTADIWGEAVPGYPVTVTTPYAEVYAWADPGCGGCWNIDGSVELYPGDTVTVVAGSGALPLVATIPDPVDAEVDTATDEVFGQIGGWLEQPVEVHGNWPDGYREVDTDGAGNFLATYPDIPRGSDGYIRFVDDVSFGQAIFHRPFWAPDLILEINYGHDWVEGFYEPGHTVWITVTESDGTTVKGTAELQTTYIHWWDDTGFSTNWDGWQGDHPDMQPGDWVYGKVDNGYSNATQIGDIDFQVDYDTDLVFGTLTAPLFIDPLRLRCEVWGHPDDPGLDDLVDPAGGPIDCDFGGAGYDIAPGHSVGVMYWEPDDDRIINVVDWPSIRARYGPNSDGNRQVWGHGAEPFGTVVVTVTTELGSFVAGETTTADDRGNWNANNLPEGTLDLWNEILVDFGNGLTDTMQIYPMGGVADPDTDWVTVTAAGPPFFGVDLEYCQPDGWCDWHSMGEIGSSGVVSVNLLFERGFDVRHGDSFDAHLYVWNSHEVIYAWNLPAPELGVWKWHIDGHARPGGVYPYGISFVNNGNGPAENTLIVDTLPPGTSYADDTSGYPVTIGAAGQVITWDLGTVDPGTDTYFVVTVNVSSTVPTGTGSIDENCLAISTTSEGDWNPDNDNNCAEPVDVWEDEVEIGVDKGPDPSDPTPGQEFDYWVQWCNNRGAAAGPVVLTDTLPVGVELLDWWVDDWFNPWQEMTVDPNQLVLYAPSLPGNRCDGLTMRVLLDGDVPISTTLENLVEITVADDVDIDNNWRLDDNVHVSEPRYELWVGKSRNDGILVPGGYAGFSIDYSNHGNVETMVWVTDTLPLGFSYVEGWWAGSTPWQGDPIPPPTVTATISGDQLVWKLPSIPVNGQYGFNIILDIGEAVDPGPELENCAVIAGEGEDDYPNDNESCLTFTVQPPGPNLWVEKWHNWNGDGQLRYQFNFANFGDQMVSDVWLTDTLPPGTHWNGWWQNGFEWERLVGGDLIVDGDRLLWHFSQLYPGEWGWIQFDADLDEPGAPLRWYTNTVEITIPPGETDPGDNIWEDGAFSGGEVQWMDLDVYGQHIWGYAPWGPIHIQTAHEEAFMPWDGDFDWEFEHPFLPGDLVTVTAGPGDAPVVVQIPEPFDVEASSITDHVWGQIDHLDSVWLDVDRHNGPNIWTQTDSNGFFDVLFPDIPRGDDGEVRYREWIDYTEVTYHRYWRSPDLILEINYGHDWVEGRYEPGHTIWITVTESDGSTVKGTAELWSGEVPWWGGDSGFSTNWHGWTSTQPDIAPGDWVFGKTDTGFTTEVQIFSIDGFVDVDGDYVMGALDAPWYVGVVDNLEVECHPWGAWDVGVDAEVKYSQAPPDGSAPFLCEWDPATEWDIDYMQQIGIWVRDLDGDSIINVFEGEAVDLFIGKNTQNDYARPGGVAVYVVIYANNGNIPAEGVKIVDTLPEHTSYAGDTSGFPVTIGAGNVITWDMGTVDPGELVVFRLTLDVAPDAPIGTGTIISNYVMITTTTTPVINPEDDEISTGPMDVQPDEIEIGVEKWAWPEDPTPGEIFYYNIQWCNNRGAAAGPVVMTDTLPVQATLLEWHEREWWMNFWTEVSYDGTDLVLYAPGLPGDRCEEINLLMELDPEVPISTTLVNEVTMITAGDVFTDNDYMLYDGAHVSPPRYDLGIHKGFHNGIFSPGGWGVYQVDFWNVGNISSGVVITEVVPPGLIFEGAWWVGGQEDDGQPLPPPDEFGNLLIWELDPLPVGGHRQFHIEFNIDPDALPGTEFGNCVTISLSGDDQPDDNESCESMTVNPPGPNLRVIKSHQWPNEEQISYDITFLNIGDEPFFDVLITDTLPISVTAANEPQIDYWSAVHIIDNTGNGEWGFVVEELPPGERGSIYFDVNLDDPGQIPAFYTNTVEIVAPGDVDPGDNVYEDLAGKILDTVLRVSPPLVQLSVGDTFTVDVEIENVTDLQAITLEMTFDPALVEVVDADPGTGGVQIIPGDCPASDTVLQNAVDNVSGVINYDTFAFLSPACDGGGVVMKIVFRALDGGTSPVQFSAWSPINSDGFDIPVLVEDGEIEISSLGLLQGQVELQGRKNHSGARVVVEDSLGATAVYTTDSTGLFSFWLDTDFYTVTVEMASYLGAEKGDVFVAAGSSTTLAKVKLLGGDVDGSEIVDILDLAIMGGRYLSACGDPSYDARADVNNDCLIDIRDLAIAGGNYLETSPVAWP